MKFKLVSPFKPAGDQPKAIKQLLDGYLKKGYKKQTLLGVTGSGKTFVAASVIEKLGLPTLVISPNKTLAAQLYSEFKTFFPENAVEYFVSYFDYYQPEAYLPQKDLYIAKDSSINEEIEKLRDSTLRSLAERDDVIVVASVSCIYNVGLPKAYRKAAITFKIGQKWERNELLTQLVKLLYIRNEHNPAPKTFRVRGNRVEIFPSYSEHGIRLDFFDETLEKIITFDPITGKRINSLPWVRLFPASPYITEEETFEDAIAAIEAELKQRHQELLDQGKIVEANRLWERTRYDLELLREIGTCSGIENYSRFFDGRKPGEPPYTLLDHFPEEFFMVIDESHIAIPQIRGMYAGEMSRKKNLIEYGFRLPSSIDNRPLKWGEFEKRMPLTLFMSATPGPYELKVSQQVVEQIIRPTGLVDPEIVVKPSTNQINDLVFRLKQVISQNQRALILTLTKKTSEKLSEYLHELGFKVEYIHSDIDTIDRVVLIQKLREGEIDILIGINLLREGLDLPEVALVAILDADKQGFLRSTRSLIQMIGRAARNSSSQVVLYADELTSAMKKAIQENNRRRKIQLKYNKEHNITPKTIRKAIKSMIEIEEQKEKKKAGQTLISEALLKREDLNDVISQLTEEMKKAAENLEFEKAAKIRDQIMYLKEKQIR